MSRLNYFQNRPKAFKIDVNRYLERIHVKKESPSLSFLRKIHHSHLKWVPFENLDIHYQKKIILDYEKVFAKIVGNKRGGYCYELNGLFYHLLQHLGFDCFLISGRVRNEKTDKFGEEYDHMAIIVTLEGTKWLVDVGVGQSMIYPKKINVGEVQLDYTNYWKISQDVDENYLLQYSEDSNHFKTKYLFTTEEKEIIEFMEMNEYHQVSQASPFTQEKFISRLTDEGRVTLSSRKLKVTSLGKTEEMEITNEDEFFSKLEQHFDIHYRQVIR